MELHQIWCSKRKHDAPIPLIAEPFVSLAPKEKKGKLLKLTNVTPPLLSTTKAAQSLTASAALVIVPPLSSLLPYFMGEEMSIPEKKGKSSAVREIKGLRVPAEVREDLPSLACPEYKPLFMSMVLQPVAGRMIGAHAF